MKISELQAKDVINVADGSKVGHINDMEIDLETGLVKFIMIPTETRLFGWFSGGQECIIPWDQIVKIGSDVILVKLDQIRKQDFLEEYSRPMGIIGKIKI